MCLTTHTCFPIKHLLLIKKRKNFTYIIRSVNSVVYIKFTDCQLFVIVEAKLRHFFSRTIPLRQ